jgi:hypothetical protein
MRWAEGHTHNVRKWFLPIMRSPYLTPLEKGEFLFDSTYYLQAALFVVGTVSWLISETVFHTHVPGWTAVLGWSLLFSNIFALPLMNLGGLILEEAPRRDMQGVLGALVLSFALVPFQGWAAFKGLLSKDEGPWFRTPKTGRVTDEVHHLRRLQLLRRWLLGRRARRLEVTPIVRTTPRAVARTVVRPRSRWIGWGVAFTMLVSFGGLAWLASRAPVVSAATSALYLHGSGTGPACTPSTLSQTAGAQAPPCQLLPDGITYTWSITGLPAQTITGVWDFTMYWTGGAGNVNDSVTISAGVSPTGNCGVFVPTIPNAGTTWSTTFGPSGAQTTSPFTVSTSAGQLPLVITPGAALCVSVTLAHITGGKPVMLYDGAAGVADTRVVPPSIIVPETVLGLLGFALLIPVFTRPKRVLQLLRIRP